MASVPATSASSAPIAILGAGSWGTALAIQFARTSRPTLLWGRDAQQMRELANDRRNKAYLPDAPFPSALQIEPDLTAVLQTARDIVVAVPSHALRGMLQAIQPHRSATLRLAWATKGFELTTGLLPHQVAELVLGRDVPTAVISGPTFAREVGAGLPTAMTIAASDQTFARDLAESISGDSFRAYTSTDITGVEIGGAVKNVMAIGAGISDGLGFGANTRIALITRGLVEMTRLGVALGARRETFMGLAGLGDLVLTCTDNQSRNRRFGLAIAAGHSIDAAQKEIGQVVEGVLAARAVREVASRAQVEMPICEQLCRVVHEGLAPKAAVKELMSRELKPEA
jgi:glycerol-3-phosphate dehydrogenase (NAD(P)+)